MVDAIEVRKEYTKVYLDTTVNLGKIVPLVDLDRVKYNNFILIATKHEATLCSHAECQCGTTPKRPAAHYRRYIKQEKKTDIKCRNEYAHSVSGRMPFKAAKNTCILLLKYTYCVCLICTFPSVLQTHCKQCK